MGDDVGRDADAGVVNLKAQFRSRVVLPVNRDIEENLALGGEFDGVPTS